MGFGSIPYQEAKTGWGGLQWYHEGQTNYGKRLVKEWLGLDIDPEIVSSAWECGWHSSSVTFDHPQLPCPICVGYEACNGPSWASSYFEKPGEKVDGNPFDMTSNGKQIFATSTTNYPIHPSLLFNYYNEGQKLAFSTTFDKNGLLTHFASHELDYKPREGHYLFLFWNPSGGNQQPLPNKSFKGPSDEMLHELCQVLLGQRPAEECQMLELLRKPMNLVEGLLSEFGNSRMFSVDKKVNDKVAYIINSWIRKPKPWDWINTHG